MAERKNFLLGYGERLVEPLAAPLMSPDKSHPYTLESVITRIGPQLRSVSASVDSLPDGACPGDQAVALFTLHPTYVAKSYFPAALMRTAGFEVIGTRAREIVPVVPTGRGKEHSGLPQLACDLYVAGTRDAFRRFRQTLPQWPEVVSQVEQGPRDERGRLPSDDARLLRAAQDLRKLEQVRFQPAQDRVRPFTLGRDATSVEVVLHASADAREVLQGFVEYARSLDLRVDLRKRLHASGLCFLAMRASLEQVAALAEFSFLRVVREMPRLRQLEPAAPLRGRRTPIPIRLPDVPAVDASMRVALFDGGLPDDHPLGRWVRSIDLPGLGPSLPEYTRHGLSVTSALLFGPITPGELPPTPYASVDHYRVLDDQTALDNPDELFTVLRRIQAVLTDREYEFVSLSLGPDLAIDDDEVHSWTAVLDQVFSRGRILASVAVGNGGELDRAAGNARIQTPADCVNALAIGAADSSATPWQRAGYSSIGPGRSPGVVKPDLLAFGGSALEPFFVVESGPVRAPKATGSSGTSLAAPSGLRTGLGIRSVFGPVLSPVALKALLIHGCESSSVPDGGDRAECGWGRIPFGIEPIVMSDNSTARIVYQGELEPGQYVRMPIPYPKQGLLGKVDITATFCFLAGTDPQDPMSYTRSGLEVRFRPHANKKLTDTSRDAKPKGFFRLGQFYLSERQLRDDAHKWETTLHQTGRMLGTSLHYPVFDVHYNARVAGRNQKSLSEPIPYALVVTVRAPKEPRLYDRLVQQYRTRLEPLVPLNQIPVRARG